MRIVGEPVTFITVKGGGYDKRGNLKPEVRVEEVIERCVVVPANLRRLEDGTVAVDGELIEATVLLPVHKNVGVDAEVVIRGEQYIVDRPPFDHRSMFGTSRGGTEIFVRRATA